MKNRKKILELLDDAVELAQASQAKAMEAKSLLGEPESNIVILGFETMPDAQLKDYVTVKQIFDMIEKIKSEMQSGRCTAIPFIKEVRATYKVGLKDAHTFYKWVESSGIYNFDRPTQGHQVSNFY